MKTQTNKQTKRKPSLEVKCQKFKPFRDVFDDQKFIEFALSGFLHSFISVLEDKHDKYKDHFLLFYPV